MKNLSLKLDNEVFDETEEIVKKLDITRNRYFNEAIEFYNRFQKRKILQKKLAKESYLTRDESMTILKEFDSMDYGDPTI